MHEIYFWRIKSYTDLTTMTMTTTLVVLVEIEKTIARIEQLKNRLGLH
jgi:hypothetical protein